MRKYFGRHVNSLELFQFYPVHCWFFSELFCFLWLKLKNVNRWIWSLQTSAACMRMVIFVCYILTHEHQTREMQFHQAEAAQPWQSSKKWEQQRTNNLFFFFFFPHLFSHLVLIVIFWISLWSNQQHFSFTGSTSCGALNHLTCKGNYW